MVRPPFLSFSREPLRSRRAHVREKSSVPSYIGQTTPPLPPPPRGSHRRGSGVDNRTIIRKSLIPWIESPLDEKDGDPPHLYRHSDATPIELFFDLFLVANLSTFTATHEINDFEALWAYVGFLGVIWFTWFQVTLFDIRFARDSIFERFCKAVQLAAMVGFASAGSRFATHVSDENVWAFQALTILLAGSRVMLAIQYTIHIRFVYKKLGAAAKGLSVIVVVLFVLSIVFAGLYFVFGQSGNPARSLIWTVWFALFAVETLVIMGVSSWTPGIGFEDTHLNVRMGLLTLIIIGEGVISVTRIVNKTVGPGGWTKWSFVHILGVSTNVYLLWQAYFDLSPRANYGKMRQQIWAQLHFPFHVVLILLLEGSQILALTLDVALKLKYLGETIVFACEEPRPDPVYAVKLLKSTIVDMEIDYGGRNLKEKEFIDTIIETLSIQPLCPVEGSTYYSLTHDRANDLMGNVTVALFSSMDITPSTDDDISQLDSGKLLMMYVKLLGFVYVYFFVVAALAMVLFAIFVFLTRRHLRMLYRGAAVGTRIVLAVFLASFISFMDNFDLAYSFMTSPMILFTFTLTLLAVLLVDRFLDWLAAWEKTRTGERQGSESGSKPMTQLDLVVGDASASI